MLCSFYGHLWASTFTPASPNEPIIGCFDKNLKKSSKTGRETTQNIRPRAIKGPIVSHPSMSSRTLKVNDGKLLSRDG